ncbi:hypothetical protein KUTeg_000735 [Tegillarca granosa]|uniref:Uncharacterized protein n=1 Tax=Tegillarca granosa TaxID=220873 RepID=A0ABQ9FYH0_TEGGR|nr:hypothetical protein KUTeg_000735 [Tegillarca granosa]
MALDLLKYCSTIRWAASKVPGPSWRQYDEQFRHRRAKKTSKSWARLDLDLWLLFISASTPLNNPSQKFNFGTKELAGKPRDIWIVGSSIVYWAQRRALSRPVGRNLGLEKYGVQIRWCSIRVSIASGVLRWEMKLDLLSLSKLPNTTVVWSCILPRLFWYGARSQVAIDNVRGRVITKSDLSDKETGCYRFDGIHLSDIGNDIYLNALQGTLKSFLLRIFVNFNLVKQQAGMVEAIFLRCWGGGSLFSRGRVLTSPCRCFIGHSSLIGLFVKLDIYKVII